MANVHGIAKGAAPLPDAPLQGARIAVTRAGDRGAPLAALLAAAGATVHELPLTRIEALEGTALEEALTAVAFDWIVLTSVNAVTHLAQAIARVGGASRHGRARLAVVGATTAAAVEAEGWGEPAVRPEQAHAEGLLDALASRGDVAGRQVLYPCAAGARDVLPDGLRALGAEVQVVPVYRSAPDPDGQARVRALVAASALDLVTVAAPSAVDALQDAVPPEHAGRLPVACIGPVTARAARMAGFPVAIESTASTTEGFARAIIATWPVHAMSRAGNSVRPRLP